MVAHIQMRCCLFVCCAKDKLVAGTPEFVHHLLQRKFTEYVWCYFEICISSHFGCYLL